MTAVEKAVKDCICISKVTKFKANNNDPFFGSIVSATVFA